MSRADDNTGGWTPENELIATRHAKAQALREVGINPYANGFDVESTAAEIFETYGDSSHEELEAEEIRVSVAGRVRFRRLMGKASFLKIQDWTCRPGIKPPGIKPDGETVPPTDDYLQLFVKANVVGADSYKLVKSDIDLGDFIGVRGRLMRTKTGELTVQATELVLLTKSLRPLPDKWHGLSDVETRFRQRYVDLTMNSRAREVLRIRSDVVRLMREFFHKRRYLEVETPMLHSTPGGAAARPFATFHNALSLDLFLRIAPELYLKRLLVGSLGRVFEIGRVFRNEGLSRQHNPEFTILEFYEAYATYEDLMDLTEELLCEVVQSVHGRLTLQYDGREIDFSPPFRRITALELVAEALAEKLGGAVTTDDVRNPDWLVRTAQDLAEREPKTPLAQAVGEGLRSGSWGKLVMALFDELVEPSLVNPTFVTQYPADVSPLSRRNDADEAFVDRFELFVAGSELANAFSELNDPVDQYERFEDQLRARAAGDDEAHPMDADYVRALEYGMPPAAGEGIGIDRLIMLLTDAPSIREVIPFPLLRPEGGAVQPDD